MELGKFLAENYSKEGWKKVITYVLENPAKFEELLQLFLSTNLDQVKQSAQPFGQIIEKRPQLITPHWDAILKNLRENPIPPVTRNTMRGLQFCEYPEEYIGELFEIGMDFLSQQEIPVATKAFSMTVLRRICEHYPELAQEVIHQIEILVSEKLSKGIVARGNEEIAQLKKLG